MAGTLREAVYADSKAQEYILQAVLRHRGAENTFAGRGETERFLEKAAAELRDQEVAHEGTAGWLRGFETRVVGGRVKYFVVLRVDSENVLVDCTDFFNILS